MADDPKNRGEPDRSRINISQGHELDYWSERFGITREELKRAVNAVGFMPKDVAKHLGKSL